MKVPLAEPQLRLPASTPRVSRSSALHPTDVILVEPVMFEDDRRRIVVGSAISDDTMKVIGSLLDEFEFHEGRVRWVRSLLEAPVEDGRGAV